jgi:type I restriction enzyme, S subunit
VVRRAELSVSIIKVSELVGSKRIDPEYYQPHYQALQAKLKSIGARTIESFAYANDGFHESPIWVDEGGIPCISAKCVKDNYFVLAGMGQVSLEQRDKNPTKEARIDDVLITSVGTIGNSAVVHQEILPAIMDRHVGIIRIHPDTKVDPYYLAAFFNSKYGRFQTLRESTGNVQLNLFVEKIQKLLVPVGDDFNVTGKKVRNAYDKFSKSKEFYVDAEKLLASELGIQKFELPNEDIAIRDISEVLKVKRIDAEYFHPQKAYAKEWISKFSGKTVGDYFEPIRDIYNPPSQDTGKSILNFDLTHALHYFLDEDGEIIPENEIGSLKKRIQKDDVVVSRLRSYLREIAIVEVPPNTLAVGSSEFIVLRSAAQKLFPEALLVYLRILPVQTILKWSQDGSNHPRFQTQELMAIKVPDAVLKIQDEVRRMIRAGMDAHKQAKRLLSEAKQEVEKLIEGN